jgi:oligopeptide transport system permease protein
MLLGIVLGVVSVIHKNRIIDKGIVTFSVVNAALPVFALASLLQYFFATRLRLLPTARWGTPQQMILPVLSVMIGVCAGKARAVRTMLIEVSEEFYISAGRSHGLSTRQVLYRHGVRNALIPLLSPTGMELANVLTGTFVIEQVYAIPGFGTNYVNAVMSLDYSVILGMTIFYTVLIVVLNLFVDILYCIIDPRIRISAGKGKNP